MSADDIRRQIASAIAAEMNGREIDDLGEFHSGSFGVMVGGRIVPRNKFDLPSEEDAIEWHAVIRMGMPDGEG
jgi:hypothetical protein